MKKAALYLRSSKDRADASITAQERALRELAKARGYLVTETYADAVESGKDDDRPSFQRLIAAVRNRSRGWDTILVLDTARIARRRLLAMLFEEQECKRHGVTIIYKSLPDGDPVTDMLIKSILQAMDEWHSLTSRAKGLAGMAENVRAGFRAGGRAPYGYRLEKVTTGAIRDGEPVSKTRLVLDPNYAATVNQYLTVRSTGVGRKSAAEQAGLELPTTTLINLEWNALIYAGHTVWNIRNEKGSALRRRPRSEWLIQRNTHEAMIDDGQAELLLSYHENKLPDKADRRQRMSNALLGGLLVTPDGNPWYGDGIDYRLKQKGAARTIRKAIIDSAVTEQLFADMQSARLVQGLTAQVQVALNALGDDSRLIELKKQDAAIGKRISTFMDMASEMTERGPALRKIEELEKERANLQRELTTLEKQAVDMKSLNQVTEAQVSKVLTTLAENLKDSEPAELRAALEGFLEKVELHPVTLEAKLHYRIHLNSGVKVASPRGSLPNPAQGVLLRVVLPFYVESPRNFIRSKL